MTAAQEILNAIMSIFTAPFREPSSLWILVPLFVIWFILVIYFDIHKSEKLGWNTALGNGLTLCWITLDLMRHLFADSPDDFTFRFMILIGVLLYAVLLMFISFAHKAKATITFALASPTAIYYLAMIAVMWGYGALELSLWTFIAAVILFVILVIFVWILKKILPQAKDSAGDLGGDFGGDLGGGMGGDLGGGLGGSSGGMGDLGGGLGGSSGGLGGSGGMGGGSGGGLPPMPKL